ncbi:MAG: hypothetical protein RLZ81_1607, partial [Pseudomonadota bacterium]
MQFKTTFMTAALSLVMAHAAQAAVTPEEAKALGSNLTPMGAEKAANRDGSIPAWSGGMKAPPACYKKGEGRLCDPFATEKPLFSIDAQNMDKHADKLSEGQKAMFKKNPGYRIDM